MSELRAAMLDIADTVVVPLAGRVNLPEPLLPEPLVPFGTDLRGYEFMPLKIQRLKRSGAWRAARRRPELGFYMLNLWTFAFHELPAGSLENDEEALCDAAECVPERWPEVRDQVMRGWVLCSDGRWYHAVVAEVVHECLGFRGAKSKAGKAGADKRWGGRDPEIAAQIAATDGDGKNGSAIAAPWQCHGSAMAENGKGQGQDSDREETLPLGFSDEKPSEREPRAAAREAPSGATSLSQDFSVPQEWIEEGRAYRAAKGQEPANLVFEAETFVRKHRASGTRCVDWHEKWLDWVHRSDPSKEAAALGTSFRGSEPPEKPPPEPIAHELGEAGDRLVEQLGPGAFRRWFAACEAAIDADGAVTLVAPGKFAAARLRQDYAGQIAGAWPGRRVEIIARPGSPRDSPGAECGAQERAP